MAEHSLVKPQKIVNMGIGFLEQQLLIPNLFHKEGFDQFKGSDDDTVNIKVEGVLPFRDYDWRSGSKPGTQRAPIEFDEYSERKIAVRFGGNVYQAVKVTDEQSTMDELTWGRISKPQAKAVARGLQRRAVSALTGAEFEVVIGGLEQDPRGALLEARRVLNLFHAPGERFLVVGTEVEMALLNDRRMTLASSVGDDTAEHVLKTAELGKVSGFTVLTDTTIPADQAFAITRDAFAFVSGAPVVPLSTLGATTTFEGISMRWVRDYDSTYQSERSVFNTYAGFRPVTDVLVGWDESKNREVVTEKEYLVRAVKLALDGANKYPAKSSELARTTGVNADKPWKPRPDEGTKVTVNCNHEGGAGA